MKYIDKEIMDKFHEGCIVDPKTIHIRNDVTGEFTAISMLDLHNLIIHQQNEIYKLKSQVNQLKNYDKNRDAALHARLIAASRSEAVKEFAERLKETKFKHDNHYIVYSENIDVLVKEMAGENNG